MFSREFFHQLEDEINRARHEINEKHMGIRELQEALKGVPGTDGIIITYQELGGGDQLYVVNGKVIRTRRSVPIEAVVAEYLKDINLGPAGSPEAAIRRALGSQMSAIDRIRAKALEARGIAPAMIKEFEGDLDSLIAEGPKLKAAKDAAVSEHTAAFDGLRGEFDGLKSVIDILSNGGPSLDPLPESGISAPESST